MIGLFLGDTDFSNIVVNKIKKLKKKYFIIVFSKNNKFQKDKNSFKISIGKFKFQFPNLVRVLKINSLDIPGFTSKKTVKKASDTKLETEKKTVTKKKTTVKKKTVKKKDS